MSPTSPANETTANLMQRCYQCFRPLSYCFCDAIPRIDNRTEVLILQHIGERLHPFNTARIVQKALRRCRLISDHNQRFAAHDLPIQADAGLLYPAANARLLSELPIAEQPRQLVIIDGTWHQAKTIVRDVPHLRALPCYRLSPSSPGQYRIRREPNEQCLATLEATVAALQALEPETIGLAQLLSAFHQMIERQLAHTGSRAAGRQNRRQRSRPRHFPQSLLRTADSLVVAYGEATPGQPGQHAADPLPVNWVAERLGTGERFGCILHQQPPLQSAALEHMGLSAEDFGSAVSPDEFRRRWDCFLRRDDILIVYHERTSQLLRHIEAARPSCLILKSIFGKWRGGIHSIENLIGAEGVTLPNPDGKSRASHRLDMAVELVQHLRTRYGNLP